MLVDIIVSDIAFAKQAQCSKNEDQIDPNRLISLYFHSPLGVTASTDPLTIGGGVQRAIGGGLQRVKGATRFKTRILYIIRYFIERHCYTQHTSGRSRDMLVSGALSLLG